MHGRINGVCITDRTQLMSKTSGKVIKIGRLLKDADEEGENDSEECKYAAERTSVLPVESKMESIRCKHETNTGIFCMKTQRLFKYDQ